MFVQPGWQTVHFRWQSDSLIYKSLLKDRLNLALGPTQEILRFA